MLHIDYTLNTSQNCSSVSLTHPTTTDISQLHEPHYYTITDNTKVPQTITSHTTQLHHTHYKSTAYTHIQGTH